MESQQEGLLKAALRKLRPGQLKVGLERKMGLLVQNVRVTAMITRVLKVAYQNEGSHAHAWENVCATFLTRVQLEEIATLRDRCGARTLARQRQNTCEQCFRHGRHSTTTARTLRLKTKCHAASNKKAVVAALIEADWKEHRRVLRPKLKVRSRQSGTKKSKASDSTVAGLLLRVQKDRIKEATQQAFQAQGLGSTMESIRKCVSERTEMDCSRGPAMLVCDKALSRILADRAPPNLRHKPVFVASKQEASSQQLEWAAMSAADLEAYAQERECAGKATGQWLRRSTADMWGSTAPGP